MPPSKPISAKSKPLKLDNLADVQRQFWASFIGSTVEKDGQVPGFSGFEKKMDERARALAWKYCNRAGSEIHRGTDPLEAIADSVAIAREQIRLLPDPDPVRQPETPSEKSWIAGKDWKPS